MRRLPLLQRPAERPADGPPTSSPAAEVMRSPLATRLSRAGLWTLVAIGALGGLTAAVRPSPATPETPPETTLAVPSDALGVAELAARTWLSTAGASLTDPDATPAAGAGDRIEVVTATAVAARPVEVGYWAIVVAADVRLGSEATTPPGRWFLEVGVAAEPDGPVAVAAPAMVPAPATSDIAMAGPQLAAPRRDDTLTTTVESFLGALLTGTGDVTRYLAPGSTGRAVQPPPFTAVRVTRAATVEHSPEAATVRVAAEATTVEGAQVLLGYEVTLARRAERWEVRSFTGAPALAGSRHRGPATAAPPPRRNRSPIRGRPRPARRPPRHRPRPNPNRQPRLLLAVIPSPVPEHHPQPERNPLR